MDVPEGFSPALILGLNLAGTFVFGLSTAPSTFRDWRYLAAAGAAGAVCFAAGRWLDRAERGVMVFDALGLGLFAVTGATKALQVGLGPVQAILLGTITGVGGGILRDVLLREVPTVLREGLYAVPALLGATVLVVGQESGSSSPALPVLAAAACVVVRLLGLRYGVDMPRPRGDREDGHR